MPSSGTTKAKQAGFLRYVKTTSDPTYNDYVRYCKSRRIPIYSRHGYENNLDTQGIESIEEKTDTPRTNGISSVNSPSENSASILSENSINDDFSIESDISTVNKEASYIAEKYKNQVAEKIGAPIGNVGTSSHQEQKQTSGAMEGDSTGSESPLSPPPLPKEHTPLDPEVFGYLPMAGVNLVIKRFIDSENAITNEEADQIKEHSIKLIEKYADDIAGEYAEEVNFAMSVTNPMIRAAMDKADKQSKQKESQNTNQQSDNNDGITTI